MSIVAIVIHIWWPSTCKLAGKCGISPVSIVYVHVLALIWVTIGSVCVCLFSFVFRVACLFWRPGLEDVHMYRYICTYFSGGICTLAVLVAYWYAPCKGNVSFSMPCGADRSEGLGYRHTHACTHACTHAHTHTHTNTHTHTFTRASYQFHANTCGQATHWTKQHYCLLEKLEYLNQHWGARTYV